MQVTKKNISIRKLKQFQNLKFMYNFFKIFYLFKLLTLNLTGKWPNFGQGFRTKGILPYINIMYQDYEVLLVDNKEDDRLSTIEETSSMEQQVNNYAGPWD